MYIESPLCTSAETLALAVTRTKICRDHACDVWHPSGGVVQFFAFVFFIFEILCLWFMNSSEFIFSYYLKLIVLNSLKNPDFKDSRKNYTN